MIDNTQHNETPGPEVYENWRKWLAKNDDWLISEYPLFSDAHITGDLADIPGPYKLINMVPATLGKCLAPTVALRIAHPHGMINIPPMTKTDDSRFHGGTLVDEIAALLSLQLGVRFKAGKSVRTFYPQGDAMGDPRAFELLYDPVTPNYCARPVVPDARGKHSLSQADLLPHL